MRLAHGQLLAELPPVHVPTQQAPPPKIRSGGSQLVSVRRRNYRFHIDISLFKRPMATEVFRPSEKIADACLLAKPFDGQFYPVVQPLPSRRGGKIEVPIMNLCPARLHFMGMRLNGQTSCRHIINRMICFHGLLSLDKGPLLGFVDKG